MGQRRRKRRGRRVLRQRVDTPTPQATVATAQPAGKDAQSETAKERRMEINKWRPQDGREEREETTRVQKHKEKRQTSLSFQVK